MQPRADLKKCIFYIVVTRFVTYRAHVITFLSTIYLHFTYEKPSRYGGGGGTGGGSLCPKLAQEEVLPDPGSLSPGAQRQPRQGNLYEFLNSSASLSGFIGFYGF